VVDRLLTKARRSPLRAPVGVRAIMTALVALAALPGIAQAQFAEGFQDPDLNNRATPAVSAAAFGAVATTHSTFERLAVPWKAVAPVTRPAGFNAANPADPNYRWANFDATIELAVQHHLNPILFTYYAPPWAEGPNRPTDPSGYDISPGSWDPSLSEFKKFTRAMVTRYSGTFPDPLHPGATLPRVRYWEIWNEPNIPGYFAAPNSVEAYRAMLNAGYAIVKSVHADNTVLAAGLAPTTGGLPNATSPLKFAANLLCVRRVRTHFVRGASCPQKARFNVLNMHPYGFGSTPTKHAYRYDDVLAADMSKLRKLLNTAQRLHTVTGKHKLWVTEFAWATNPPNPTIGDSPATAARYIAYAMYEMWKAQTSLVIWAPLSDKTGGSITELGTGVLAGDGTPRLSLQAFAFPFVATVSRRRGSAWGRVPVSRRVKVFVQHKTKHGWRTVSSVRTGRDGVFTAHFAARGNGTYRARVAHGQTSLEYFSARIPGKRIHAVSF
jgi:hypothetical protein